MKSKETGADEIEYTEDDFRNAGLWCDGGGQVQKRSRACACDSGTWISNARKALLLSSDKQVNHDQ